MDVDAIWSQASARMTTDLPDNPETDPAVPDGEYDAEVLDFRCFLDKSGRWWMKWILGVRGGLLDGRLLVRFVEVKPQTAEYLKADVFHCLGREAAFGGELADIPTGRAGPAASEMRGAVVLARLRSRQAPDGRVFRDVYINGSVSLPSSALPAAEEPKVEAFSLPPAPSRDARHTDVPFPADSDAPLEDPDDEIPF